MDTKSLITTNVFPSDGEKRRDRMTGFLSPVVCALVLSLFVMNCANKPKACPTCTGTGKVTRSDQVALPFEIVYCKVTDRGLFNPDYLAAVTVENKGESDGTFTIFVDFNYSGIGTHTEEGEVFVKAYSKGTKEIRYDSDKRADDYKCRVKAPLVIETTQLICPTCGGSGLIK